MARHSRTLWALVSALAAAACVDTMDAGFKIHGVIPPGRSCLLTVVDMDTNQTQKSAPVSGDFEESVVTSGWFSGPYRVSVACDGRVLKSVDRIYASVKNWNHPVDLGKIEP